MAYNLKSLLFPSIFSDPSSLLGVRLPPDTEIIKYTSSIVGPKIPGTTNRGRKKTISLDPNPLLATLQGLSAGIGVSPAKRARLEAEYVASLQNAAAMQNDRVEVIKLPPTITSNGAYNLSKSSLQTKDSNIDSPSEWGGLNLSSKVSTTSSADESDTPLNLCMKSDSKSTDYSGNSGNNGSSSGLPLGTTGSNSLQSLSSITAALGSGSGNDRMRK